MQNLSRNRSTESSPKNKSKEIEYTNEGIEKVINSYIHSERDRKILKRRLIDGICLFDLAEEFSLSPRQMQRIVTKGENIVFKYYLGDK